MSRIVASVSLKAAVGLLLMICTTAEVLYYSHINPAPSPDEVKCSISTVNFVISNRRPVLFLYSNSYMAPLLEMAAVPICALTKSAPLPMIRATGALFLGLSALLLFETLTLEFGLLLSSAVTIAYTLGTPWLLFWKLEAPGYPAGLLCCFGFLFIFLKFRPAAFALGVLAGLLHYVFPISIGFIIAAFVSTLAPRDIFSSLAGTLRTALRSNRVGGTFCIGVLTAATLLGAGAAYGILTGRLRGRAAAVVLSTSVSLALATCSDLIFLLHRIRPLDLQLGRRIAAPPAMFLLGYSLVEIPVQIVFRLIEIPYFSSRGVQLWSGNDYSRKQWPAWPAQLFAYVDRILRQALVPIGSRGWIPLYERTRRPELAIILGLLSLVAILVAARRLYRSHLACSRRFDGEAVDPNVPFRSGLTHPSGALFAAFAIMSVFLIPSWRLFGDPSVRYLTPYFPAIYLAIAVLLRDFAKLGWRFRRISRTPPRLV